VLTKAWVRYIASYHQAHPGITEQALDHARHPDYGSAYEWLALAVPRPTGDVLDLACGSCPIQPLLDPRQYLGIDTSAAELAAARAAGRGPVEIGDATAIPAQDGSFDVVVMSMALMLVPEREALREIARVLRPGGSLVGMVPATGPVLLRDVPALIALAAPLLGPGQMPQQVTTRSLGHLLVEAGLRPRTRQRVRFPFPIAAAGDAELAVDSLYTPGRSDQQRQRAVEMLQRIGHRDLPVPLLRFTAAKPTG
jgi:SAM-dependent methyltransferase